MKLNLPVVFQKHLDKTGFVFGLGPSLSTYHDQFKELSKDKEKNTFISCNDWDIMTEIDVDYWVIANSVMTVEKYYDRFISKPNSILVYSDTVDLTDRYVASKLLTNINYLPYDQRHFGNVPCPVKFCCHHLIQDRLTIQEFLQDIALYHEHYSTSASVATHALALSIILGCNPIYIVGVDLDYSKGYIDGTTNNDTFDHHMPELLSDFNIINESAKKMGVEIFNMSEHSKLKDIFKFKNHVG